MTARDPEALFADTLWLRRLVRALVPDDAQAEDIAQDSLLAGLQQPPDDGAGRPWLARVARNLAASLRRREARRHSAESQAAAADRAKGTALPADEVVAAGELQRVAVAALMELAEPYRTTLLLRFLKGMTRLEIAARMGVELETVRSRQKRGLALLRRRLDRGAGGAGGLLAWLALPLPLRPVPPGIWRSATLYGALFMHTKTLVTAAAALLVLALGTGWFVLSTGPAPTLVAATGAAPTLANKARPGTDGSPSTREEHRARIEVPADRTLPGAAQPAVDEARRTGDLVVRVTDPFDRPAGQVGVLLNERGRAVPRLLVTDSAGRATFRDIAAGAVWLRIDRMSTELEAVIRPGRETTLQTRLVGAGLRGRVLDPLGRPVAGATVWIAPLIGRSAHPVPVATTDLRGSFSVSAVHPHVWIGAATPGLGTSDFAMVSALRADARATSEAEEVELVLPGGPAALRGVVRDPEGRPVAAAWVRAGAKLRVSQGNGTASHWLTPPRPQVATDPDGRFMIDGLRPGHLPVEVYAPGFAAWLGALACGASTTAELEVRLERGGSLTAQVLDAAGQAIEGAEIRIREFSHPHLAQASTDSDGRFRIDDLPVGERTVRIDAAAKGRIEVPVTIAAGEVRHHEFRLGTGPVLGGVLLDPKGQPLSGWRVRRESLFNEAITTDTMGRFEIRDCEPRAHDIAVYDKDTDCRVTTLRGLHPAAARREHRIRAGAMPSCIVTGRVLGRDGAAIEGVSIALYQDELVPAHVLFTDAKGRFASMPLPPGRFELELHDGGDAFEQRRLEPLELAAGQRRDLGDLRLEPVQQR